MSLLGGIIQGGLSMGGGVGGRLLDNYFNKKSASKERAFQEEFAKHGLRWKVEDARKAGINPLAALGTTTHSPSASIGSSSGSDLGMSKLGQDINRAMTSKMTTEEREIHELNKRLLEVKIDGQTINNNNARNIGTGNSFPTSEYTGSPQDVARDGTKQKAVDVDRIRQTGVIAGAQSKYQYVVDDNGNLSRQPTEKQAEIQESDYPTSLRENIKMATLAARSFTSYGKGGKQLAKDLQKVRPVHPKKGWEYRWDRFKLHWVPTKRINKETQLYHQRNPRNQKRIFKVR